MSTLLINCSKKSSPGGTAPPPPTPPPVATNDVDFWLTNGDQSIKLQKQGGVLSFGTAFNTYTNFEVNESETFQSIEGFGYSLTGGSAEVIDRLNADKKEELLQDLFGNGPTAIGVSYLRISIGASDLDGSTFSYNDLPAGQTDVTMGQFSIAPDRLHLIPVLKSILKINPAIKIMGSPWSPPVWMKSPNSTTGITGTVGGSLMPQYYNAYAKYFVKYIEAMKAEGIAITAITPQNEPLNPANNPSLLMLASQQADFIKSSLGPAFQSAGITTKIISYDHNCDRPDYPMEILNDNVARTFVAGSAFHLYGGDISALTTVHNAHPDKDVYFTEQWTSSIGDFAGDLSWHTRNVTLGSMRNWSKNALEWNLATDGSFSPHTQGGCNSCKGAITVETSSTYTKNVSYYIIGQVSKFVPAGSVRISSNVSGSLYNAAFKTPEGKKVMVVLNDGPASALFNIKYNGKWITSSLNKNSVGTYIW